MFLSVVSLEALLLEEQGGEASHSAMSSYTHVMSVLHVCDAIFFSFTIQDLTFYTSIVSNVQEEIVSSSFPVTRNCNLALNDSFENIQMKLKYFLVDLYISMN